MVPGIYDLNIYQGSTFTRRFNVSDLDLSEFDSVRMDIRQRPDDTVVWSSAEHTGSLVIDVSGSNNAIVLTIDANDTALFDMKYPGGYDIELITDGTPDVVDKILRGSVVIIREYTEDES